MKPDDVQREIDRMTENIKAGGDIHSGDGGYSVATEHKPHPWWLDGELLSRTTVMECIKAIDPQTGDKRICDMSHEEFWRNQCVYLIKSRFGLN